MNVAETHKGTAVMETDVDIDINIDDIDIDINMGINFTPISYKGEVLGLLLLYHDPQHMDKRPSVVTLQKPDLPFFLSYMGWGSTRS